MNPNMHNDATRLLTPMAHNRLQAFAGAVMLAALAGIPAESAQAELLCNCAQVVDDCSASVSLSGTWVNIDSDKAGCSRVDYLIEGQPFTALVVGGNSQLPWAGQPLRDADVVVESCRVCAENGADETARNVDSQATSDAAATDKPQAIIKVMPDYPRQAWRRRMEGEVLVEFSVNASGVVQNIKILSSTSPIFDLPVLDAVSRFKYQPAIKGDVATVSTGVRETFYFSLQNNGTETRVTSSAG